MTTLSVAAPLESAPERSVRGTRIKTLVAICGSAVLLRAVVPIPEGLDAKSWSLLALFLASLAGLILQPVPIGVVFLSALCVGVLGGVLTPAQALAGYSNSILWLIVIAFMFARAFVKTNLGRRIALLIIGRIGTSALRLGYALSLTDLVLAPVTASNTARAGAIVFPIAVSLSREFGSNPGPTASRIGTFLLFTAYQANLVTSALFLTAMASNPLAATFASQIAGVQISWTTWLVAASLPGAISLLLVPYVIHKLMPPGIHHTPEARRYATSQLDALGPLSGHEKLLVIVFLGLAAVWGTQQLHGLDTMVAGLAALCVLLIGDVLSWDDVTGETRAWDTFVWWGAMMSLATALNQSLAPKWFANVAGQSLAGWPGLAALVTLVVVYTYIHYAFAGQTAHVVALYPPFLTVAVAAGAPPLLAALLFGFFSNLNSTLTQYSDGAAPIFYGSRYIELKAWWRVGFYLSVLHLLVWLGAGLPGIDFWESGEGCSFMEQMVTQSAVTHLECSRTGTRYPAGQVHNTSTDGWPLLVRYDLEQLRARWDRDALADAPHSMWRYAPLLPVRRAENIISLSEGWTPLHRLNRFGERAACDSLWLKDEGVNPTGSFKARGISCAVSMCRELGIQKLAIPTAGNAGGALAAYAAAAGIPASIFMPRDVPLANYLEARGFGADVTLVDGLISDCGRLVAEGKATQHWFEVSTLKEPYRIEGKKTMGLEAAEQFGWELPDAIFYPTGGGVGMIGMWKAFDELEQLGWIGPKRPKMIAVQAEGCQPIVRAFETGAEFSEFWKDAATVASGLRVPKALGDFLVLKAVRESGGTAVAVSERDMMAGCEELAADEGLFVAPEGGACMAALRQLRRSGFLKRQERILIYNTGSGYKYLEAWAGHYGASVPTPGTLFAP